MDVIGTISVWLLFPAIFKRKWFLTGSKFHSLVIFFCCTTVTKHTVLDINYARKEFYNFNNSDKDNNTSSECKNHFTVK